MSLLDLILGQKLIVISMGAALLLMWGALTIAMVSKARHSRRKPIAADDAAAAEPGAEFDVFAVDDEETDEDEAAAADSTASTLTEEEASGEISSEMQNLLESVFVDEDAQARYAVLLRDTENINAQDLLALTQEVAGMVEEQA
jgi:hypothetical protein